MFFSGIIGLWSNFRRKHEALGPEWNLPNVFRFEDSPILRHVLFPWHIVPKDAQSTVVLCTSRSFECSGNFVPLSGIHTTTIFILFCVCISSWIQSFFFRCCSFVLKQHSASINYFCIFFSIFFLHQVQFSVVVVDSAIAESTTTTLNWTWPRKTIENKLQK